MRLKKLRLKNFRNLKDFELNPHPGVNFIVGKNGQGKTSVLEAVNVLSGLKSFRSSKSAEWIHFESTCSDLTGEIELSDSKFKLSVTLNRQISGSATRIARINDKVVRSSTEYLSKKIGSAHLGFHSVVFNPSDHDLVRDEPAVRRNYLDRVISAYSNDYLMALSRYRKTLEQRNAILEGLRMGQKNNGVLAVLNEQLIDTGSTLTLQRLIWLRAVLPVVSQYAHDIAPDQKNINLFYISKWLDHSTSSLQGSGHPLETIRQLFQENLISSAVADIRAGSSLVGPHRDDWGFQLGEAALKGHGSQGEVRTALLALKLAEIHHFREATGRLPVLLLDDFSSELDSDRRKYLLKFLENTDLQVFVTTTDGEITLGERFEMLDGRLTF